MDRFTEPTPTSLTRGDLAEVYVDSWEIECCAPPPVVGEESTWKLQFVSADRPHRSPELDHVSSWRVQRHDSLTLLTSGAITATWSTGSGAPPDPGVARLCGFLAGTVHGGAIPDDAPSTTGTVARVRLVSQRFERAKRDGLPTLLPVPGTFATSDVARSPRWFSFNAPPDGGVSEVGVLLDLVIGG